MVIHNRLHLLFTIFLSIMFISFIESNKQTINSAGKLVVKKEKKADVTYNIILPIKYNFFDILGKSSSIRPVILVKDSMFHGTPIEHIVSFMFAMYDRDQNGFLSYQELALFQQHTNPEIPLNPNIYTVISRLLRIENPYIGLTLHEFQSSYSYYRDRLGTNATRDLLRIKKVWEITGPAWS